MGYYEQKWLQSFDECAVILYRRYVDDIICLFNSKSDADNIFVFLNQQHRNIRFTIKKETHKQLSFLDVIINNKGDNFLISVYCKKQSIGFTLFTFYTFFI